jgi:nucleoside-diphosphate kinase
MQKTLILLKPDCVEKKICGQVITRFEEAGFTINACKMMQLTKEVLADHYSHIVDKPFYPEVEEFMMSVPVIAMVLSGENIIEKMREMLGATNCLEAAAGTIRAELGSKDPEQAVMYNICHASDGPEAAAEEIVRFFSADEIVR